MMVILVIGLEEYPWDGFRRRWPGFRFSTSPMAFLSFEKIPTNSILINLVMDKCVFAPFFFCDSTQSSFVRLFAWWKKWGFLGSCCPCCLRIQPTVYGWMENGWAAQPFFSLLSALSTFVHAAHSQGKESGVPTIALRAWVFRFDICRLWVGMRMSNFLALDLSFEAGIW